VLVVALTGVWAVLFARGIQEGLRTERGQIRVGVSSAPGPDEYPTVIWRDQGSIWQGSPDDLLRGDELTSVDGETLLGGSALRFYDRATRVAREAGYVRATTRRDGRDGEVRLALMPSPYWWIALVLSAGELVVAVVLVFCAPHWRSRRSNLLAYGGLAIGFATLEQSAGRGATAFEGTVGYAGFALGAMFGVWNFQDLVATAPRMALPYRLLGVVAGGLFVAVYVVHYFVPYSPAAGDLLLVAAVGWLAAASVLSLSTRYRGGSAVERRQIRWIVLSAYIGFLLCIVGVLVGTWLAFLVPLGIARDAVVRVLISLGSLMIPVGFLAALLGSRWLDVDRLIGATASYTVLGLLVLGAALALAPGIASAAGPLLGLDPVFARWLLTLSLVAAAIPAHLALRPRIERRLFAERLRRESGLRALADEIAGCFGTEEIEELVAERLGALLDPQSLVIYARSESGAFAPRSLPEPTSVPPFAGDSLLVRALARRSRPLAGDSSALDPFDRAALETLGVALIVPIGTRDVLHAFVCLGRKRSGDIYTREERAHLGAIASRWADFVRPAEPAAPFPQRFQRDGELWTIESRGKRVQLRDIRGLHYLATLLREPRREFSALELVRAANPPPLTGDGAEPGLHIVGQLGDAGPTLDAKARAEYHTRLRALEAELADAERSADLGRLDRASAEREALLAELESAVGGARAGSDAERARVAVTKAIKLALEKISESHPELGAHLAAAVRRGYTCAYEPDPRAAVSWEI